MLSNVAGLWAERRGMVGLWQRAQAGTPDLLLKMPVTLLPGTLARNWSHSGFHWSRIGQEALTTFWSQL